MPFSLEMGEAEPMGVCPFSTGHWACFQGLAPVSFKSELLLRLSALTES